MYNETLMCQTFTKRLLSVCNTLENICKAHVRWPLILNKLLLGHRQDTCKTASNTLVEQRRWTDMFVWHFHLGGGCEIPVLLSWLSLSSSDIKELHHADSSWTSCFVWRMNLQKLWPVRNQAASNRVKELKICHNERYHERRACIYGVELKAILAKSHVCGRCSEQTDA